MRAYLPFILLCCLAGCKNRQAEPAVPRPQPLSERLTKTWIMTDYTVQRRAVPGAATAEQQKEKLLTAGVLFHFFPNGQWAFIEGERYHSGRWGLDESSHQIRCTYAENDSSVLLFKIRRLLTDSLIADLTRGNQTLSTIFETDGRTYDAPEKCPWHPTNNDWRKKPGHAETDVEIRKRAINHLRHYYTLLEAALTNNPHTVSVKNSPSCLQIYNSGIGIRSPENIDAAWFATFYDRRDAEKCLRLYGRLMDKDGVFTGPKTRNWISDDLTLIQRMMNRLQEEG